MSYKALLTNQLFHPCSTYKEKFKWHVLSPQTLYSKDLLSCPFKHPSPCIFYIYQGSFYVLPLTTVIVYLPHLPNSLLILWGKICVLLRKTTWVLKSILAYLALFPAVAVCLWANYLTSPRLSYHIPKMETVMFLHWSIRLSE